MTMAEEKAPQITKEALDKFRALQKQISEFQKTLKPRKEAILESVLENIDIDEVVQLIEFSGKDSLSLSGEYEDKKITVIFKFGKEEEV